MKSSVPPQNSASSVSKFLCQALWFVLWVALWPVLLQAAQSGPGHTLRGKVYTPAGTPPQQSVRVRLIGSGVPVGETYTDASGNYAFTQVRNGNYQLIAEGDGNNYETTVVEVEIAFSSGNRLPQIVTRNITLQPKASSINPAAQPGTREIDASVPKEAKKEYDKGLKSAKDGKSSDAIERFEQAIKLHPKYYDAHIALGQEYAKLRNFPAARAAFQQAIEIKPKAGQAHFSLGLVLVKSAEYGEAIPALRQAIELGERGSASYLFLGVALMETGTNDEAEQMLLKALDIGGQTQPGIRLYLANFYNRVGRRAKTLEQLEAYVREAPTASNVEEIQKLIKHLREEK